MPGKVITANGLRDGEVLYRDTQGQWVHALADAAIYDADYAENELKLAVADQAHSVVGPYIMDVSDEKGPTRVREHIRSGGPTVALDINSRPLPESKSPY